MAKSAAIPMTYAAVGVVRAADLVSPALAARLAAPVIGTSRPVRRVRDSERGMHDAARRHALRLPNGTGVVYEWGTGPHSVLLVHGWRGRASQFAPLARELRSAGFRVLAFDAPAHGDGYGRRTNIRSWLEAIDEMHLRYGRFEAIVGHSLGALTALTAVREGVSTPRVAAIAPMSTGRFVFDTFASQVGLSERAAEIQRARYARSVFPESEDAWGRFDAVRSPLPSNVELLVVHDRDDLEVGSSESERLAAAHSERSRMLLTNGAGHVRVLAADETLDAVTAFVGGGLAAVDRAGDERAVGAIA